MHPRSSQERLANCQELFSPGYARPGHPPPGEQGATSQWLNSARRAPSMELGRVEHRGKHFSEDGGLTSHTSREFFHHLPPRLAKIRLDICALNRTQAISEQQTGLAGLALQCQWLASYARMARFEAVAQVATAFESFGRELCHRSVRLTDAMTRTMSQTVDLLTSLACSAPAKAGGAESARVLVVDEAAPSRLSALAALERVQITGIGLASVDTAFGLLHENAVDLIVVRTECARSVAPRVCQAIRRLPRHKYTPLLMLLPSGSWERCAVLAMSGATEVVAGRLLPSELALKVLDHFFQGRLSGS